MKIAFLASECVPYAKTGGLADVVGALPGALSELGHEVIIIMPLYRSINRNKFKIKPFISPIGVWMGRVRNGARSTKQIIQMAYPFILSSTRIITDAMAFTTILNLTITWITRGASPSFPGQVCRSARILALSRILSMCMTGTRLWQLPI